MQFFSKIKKKDEILKFKINKPLLFLVSSSRFFSTENLGRSILSGIFNYDETFTSFLESTDQKRETAAIIGSFSDKLIKNKAFLSEKRTVKIMDIGCANAKTGIKYIHKINEQSDHLPGFEYVGIDTHSHFLKEAKSKLSTEPLIKKYSLVHSDALSGNLKKRKEFAHELFDFIFISHTAYYLRNELSCRAFLGDIIKLLSTCGIAVFLHEDSTCYFRSTYNKHHFKNVSTPLLIEQSARLVNKSFNQFKSIRFTSKLNFPLLNNDLWEAMKKPEKYLAFSRLPNFTKTLELLAFIVQRDLHSLKKEGLLPNYVDDIKEAVSANNNCLDLQTHMQIIVAPDCVLRHKIVQSLEQAIEKTTEIEKAEEKNNVAPFNIGMSL